MQRKIGLQVVLVVLAVGLVAGCGGTAAVSQDTDTVIRQLRARGLNVQPAGIARQSLLSQPGRAFRIGGDTLELYEYRTEAAAVLDAQELERADLSPFGAIHVYQGGNIIALYFGNDSDVQSTLSDVVGLPL